MQYTRLELTKNPEWKIPLRQAHAAAAPPRWWETWIPSSHFYSSLRPARKILTTQKKYPTCCGSILGWCSRNWWLWKIESGRENWRGGGGVRRPGRLRCVWLWSVSGAVLSLRNLENKSVCRQGATRGGRRRGSLLLSHLLALETARTSAEVPAAI